jgi:hypothetical protein
MTSQGYPLQCATLSADGKGVWWHVVGWAAPEFAPVVVPVVSVGDQRPRRLAPGDVVSWAQTGD